MSDAVVLQYVGFQSKGAVRECAFALRGTSGKSAEDSVTIANAAFVEDRVRYQYGLDVCSLRLYREFTTQTTSFSITDAELAEYKKAHTPKSKPSASAYRGDNES